MFFFIYLTAKQLKQSRDIKIAYINLVALNILQFGTNKSQITILKIQSKLAMMLYIVGRTAIN